MKLRCRLKLHKWSKPRWLTIQGIQPITYQGCQHCPTEKVK